MNDVTKEAWKTMGKKAAVGTIILIVISFVLWLYYLGIVVLCETWGTPIPHFDAALIGAISLPVWCLLFKMISDWHSYEVKRISEKLSKEFDSL